MDIDRAIDRAARIGMAVLVILAAVALPGCLSVDKDGDVDLDIDARDFVDGAEAVDNLIRGTPPTIRLPRGSKWMLIAESAEGIPEHIEVTRDEHRPTGAR